MKILVVEDSAVERKILASLLRKEGHEVIEAQDGEAAWTTLATAASRPELVISDWIMPRMTGVELVKKIRSAEFFEYIYVILLTGNDSSEDMQDGILAGADDYITKPFDPKELCTRLSICRRILGYQEKLAYMATHDMLTGLDLRSSLFRKAEQELKLAARNKRPMSFVMADIDHFKAINDRHGHHAGDLALVHFSKIIKGRLRASDLAGRIGGEEFLIILPETDIEGAVLVAENLRQSVEASPFRLTGGDEITITASFGVSGSMVTSETSIEEMTKLADDAMYSAKNSGRNKVCVNESD